MGMVAVLKKFNNRQLNSQLKGGGLQELMVTGSGTVLTQEEAQALRGRASGWWREQQ